MKTAIKTASVLVIFLFSLPAFANERAADRARGDDSGGRGRAAAEERIRDIERRRERLSEQFREEREHARELVMRHRRALTEVERTALEAELRELLEKGFQRRHDALKERLEHLKEEYKRIESSLRKSVENKDEIIERRLESLLQTPERRGDTGKNRNRGMAREREER